MRKNRPGDRVVLPCQEPETRRKDPPKDDRGFPVRVVVGDVPDRVESDHRTQSSSGEWPGSSRRAHAPLARRETE